MKTKALLIIFTFLSFSTNSLFPSAITTLKTYLRSSLRAQLMSTQKELFRIVKMLKEQEYKNLRKK
jgi:hypothetical protein